jgi:hypothetical protein
MDMNEIEPITEDKINAHISEDEAEEHIRHCEGEDDYACIQGRLSAWGLDAFDLQTWGVDPISLHQHLRYLDEHSGFVGPAQLNTPYRPFHIATQEEIAEIEPYIAPSDNELQDFEEYVWSYYSRGDEPWAGWNPNAAPLIKEEIRAGLQAMLAAYAEGGINFQGDSVDRENVKLFIFYNRAANKRAIASAR